MTGHDAEIAGHVGPKYAFTPYRLGKVLHFRLESTRVLRVTGVVVFWKTMPGKQHPPAPDMLRAGPAGPWRHHHQAEAPSAPADPIGAPCGLLLALAPIKLDAIDRAVKNFRTVTP